MTRGGDKAEARKRKEAKREALQLQRRMAQHNQVLGCVEWQHTLLWGPTCQGHFWRVRGGRELLS